MKITTDSGSTKCTWLLDTDGQVRKVRTTGINAVQFSPEQIREVLAQLPHCGQVEAIQFYGAGCGESFPETSEKLRRTLAEHFQCDRIAIESDLLGAARALFQHGEGIACILGTGSNSCWYCDGEIRQHVPPLGYILGDEGSGAALGRNLLNAIFKGHIPLREEFLAAHDLTYEQIISRVYREPYANRFLASFVPFIHAHIDSVQVRELVTQSFRAFAERNLSRYPAGQPISFVGGVAAHFAALLRESLTQAGYPIREIVESPDDGLIKYHHGA